MPDIDPFTYAMPAKGKDTEFIAWANAHGYEWGYVDAMRQAGAQSRRIPIGWALAWLEHNRVMPHKHLAIREGFAYWCEHGTLPGLAMTDKQEEKLRDLCKRSNGVEFDAKNYRTQFDLPVDYVAGWVGKVFYGVDANGAASS